jgi:hypothetical protein
MWWNVFNPVGAIYPLIFYHVSTTINQHQKCCCNIMSVGISYQRLGIAGWFQLRESSVWSIVQGLYVLKWSQLRRGCQLLGFDVLPWVCASRSNRLVRRLSPTTWNYRLLPASRVFCLVHSTRLIWSGMVSIRLLPSIL